MLTSVNSVHNTLVSVTYLGFGFHIFIENALTYVLTELLTFTTNMLVRI